MKVVIGGKNLNLTKNQFLAAGGEGSIYVKGKTAIKIYEDPSRMIPDGKVQELSAITMPNVIKPELPVFDAKGKPIGYTMRFVKDTHALCQAFTKAFQKRNNLGAKTRVKLVDNMRETLTHVHDQNILVVDFNEMNFLVDSRFTEVYFIDVDSYQTPSYGATALMESVRDRHGEPNKFNQGTDWFAFAVVSFQLLAGVHPYKGKHPSLSGFDERMSNNVSVFNKDVRVPKALANFRDNIPKALQEWYERTFEQTLRCPPPVDFVNDVVGANVVMVKVIKGTNSFEIDVITERDEDITYYGYMRGVEVFVTGVYAYFGSMKIAVGPGAVVGFESGTPFVAYREDEKLHIKQFSSGQNEHELDATDFMVAGGRLYYKYGENIMEVKYSNGGRPMPTVAGQTMENATRMFPGVSIQSMLGKFVASYYPETRVCYQVRLESLTGYQVIDAKYDLGVLVVIARNGKQYDKFLFSINESKIIAERKVENITYTGINMAVLDKGIAVMITHEEKVEVFATTNVNKVNIIEDPDVSADMQLYAKGGKIAFTDGKRLYRLQMK